MLSSIAFLEPERVEFRIKIGFNAPSNWRERNHIRGHRARVQFWVRSEMVVVYLCFQYRRSNLMRFTKFIVLFVICTLAISIALPAFAADGAAPYKAKCAACHGSEGQGKVGPAVK